MTDWLEEIEARVEAATPGPWYPKATDDALCMNARYVSLDPGEWAHDNETFMAEPTAYDRVVAITMLQYPRLACLADAKWDENTEFIAHSRTDIPRLIARMRALEAQAERDGVVVEAAKVLEHNGIDMVVGISVDEDERRSALKDIAILRAALAARDAAE